MCRSNQFKTGSRQRPQISTPPPPTPATFYFYVVFGYRVKTIRETDGKFIRRHGRQQVKTDVKTKFTSNFDDVLSWSLEHHGARPLPHNLLFKLIQLMELDHLKSIKFLTS